MEVLVEAPTNTAPPTIGGVAQQGKTLTEAHGAWTNSPTGYTYLWLRCDSAGANCSAISGATAQTYVLVAADVGHTIRVQETAGNAGGESAPASSSPTAEVLIEPPANTSPPTIGGAAQQGKTLTEAHGSWTNSPTSYSYQWLRCDSTGANCAAISGATSQTYVPVAADVGHAIRVQETASNAGGAGSAASSGPTTAVSLPPAPTNTAPPTIAGAAQQGKTLTEAHGSWENEPDELQLPVAAMRRQRRQLHRYIRRDVSDLRARRGRRRAHDPRAGDRQQRRRRRLAVQLGRDRRSSA